MVGQMTLKKRTDKNGRKICKGLIAAVLLAGGVSVLFGCKKNEVISVTENTNYPFTYQESSKGSILVKLDGSYSPDYQWTAASKNEAVASVEVEKEEKNGMITYRIVPQDEGFTTVEFVRMKDTGEVDHLNDVPEKEPDEDTSGEDMEEEDSEEYIPEEESASEEENLSPEGYITAEGVDENGNVIDGTVITDVTNPEIIDLTSDENPYTEYYLSRLQAKDRVCYISLNITVEKKGKKKLRSSADVSEVKDYEGLTTGESDGINYAIWKDETRDLLVRITEDDYVVVSADCTFIDSESEKVNEDGEVIPLMVPERPEKGADGKDMILEVSQMGDNGNGAVYAIDGFTQGTAIVYFSIPAKKLRLVIELEQDFYGDFVKTNSFVESYTPTQDELSLIGE